MSLLSENRQRDPRLEPYIKNMATWRAITAVVGLKHAGEDEGPRPLPPIALYDFKQRCAGCSPSGGGAVADALFFAFYSDRYDVGPEKAIAIPPDHLWWLASGEDTVLLSDRITHHYTTIGKIDRNGERISFSEQWPDDFFLLPGRNGIGVAARRNPVLSISKDEFRRSVVGIVTWDTSALVEGYLTAYPEQRYNADLLSRFGFALLDAESDALAPMAARLFVRAARLAVLKDDAVAERAICQAFLAGSCGLYYASCVRDQITVKDMQTLLATTTDGIGEPQLTDGLSPRALTRLGSAAGNARDLDAAQKFFGLAIVKDPTFEDAYRLRAAAHFQDNEAVAAAEDAEQALAHNQTTLERLALERSLLDSRGKLELDWKDQEVRGRQRQRVIELSILSQACAAQGKLEEARRAAIEAVKMRPDDPAVHVELAKIEILSKNTAEAVAALRAAIKHSSDASQRAAYESLISDLTRQFR